MRPEINQSVIFTYCDDLPRASGFFREVMELDLVVDQGACHIYRLTEQSYLGVCCLPDRPRSQAGVTITLVSDDVEGWYRFLTAKGVNYVKPPSHSEQFGVFSSLFISPDGYRIEIQHFNKPDWCEGKLARENREG
ncbi:VOC family protein [Kiloniella laminariae]|uniref:VOC family protein n=1 Tax=Kiloniella laminariae TaxID=454162 RepID=A0ABT4LFQ1_9PROT|nr:VOC family protein [Kiloniella laminariae]MCZ4279941.1 VOC family protein [Kiloniella laminariae]